MSVDLKDCWDRAIPFEQWVEEAEANQALWRAIYERAGVPRETARRVDGRYRLLVLAEDWCGDAVNTVPWLARLAEETEQLQLRILRRDEHPEIMATHTTGGAHSIPVVMVLDEEYRELDWWGPRPAELQAWVLEEGLRLPKPDRYRQVRTWYARDRGRTTLDEVLAVLDRASSEGAGSHLCSVLERRQTDRIEE